MAEPTISELIGELKAAGLLLNNLFQLDNGMWRSSVRDAKSKTAYHFYDHPNPGAAVKGAIAQATLKGGVPIRENKPRVLRQSTVVEAKSGADLLKHLGL